MGALASLSSAGETRPAGSRGPTVISNASAASTASLTIGPFLAEAILRSWVPNITYNSGSRWHKHHPSPGVSTGIPSLHIPHDVVQTGSDLAGRQASAHRARRDDKRGKFPASLGNTAPPTLVLAQRDCCQTQLVDSAVRRPNTTPTCALCRPAGEGYPDLPNPGMRNRSDNGRGLGLGWGAGRPGRCSARGNAAPASAVVPPQCRSRYPVPCARSLPSDRYLRQS